MQILLVVMKEARLTKCGIKRFDLATLQSTNKADKPGRISPTV
jgi:hypothetical protein